MDDTATFAPMAAEWIFPKSSIPFFDNTVSVTAAGNITAIKCHAGMAQAIAAAMDNMEMEDVVATLAGDDTIFLLCKDDKSAQQLSRRLNSLIGR